MFTGFSPEAADFLWGIRMNNNREWFSAHKDYYVHDVYEPMKEFAVLIGEPFISEPGIVCKTSRIYRDMRMSPETPYKDRLWICIRRDCEWWAKEPCLFFEITPEGCSFGFVLWCPGVPVMNAIRADMLESPDRFLNMVEKAKGVTGLELKGTPYVRQKPCSIPALSPYFSLKNLMSIREMPFCDEMFHASFADTVRQTLQALYPYVQYCQRFTNSE